MSTFKPDPTLCPCGRPRDKCINFLTYGYDCVGLRPCSTAPGGFLQAPFGFIDKDNPYQIGPSFDEENN